MSGATLEHAKTGFVPIDAMDMAKWDGKIGHYSSCIFIKAKGHSIWVRTKKRYRMPEKVRPIYPAREIKLWR